MNLSTMLVLKAEATSRSHGWALEVTCAGEIVDVLGDFGVALGGAKFEVPVGAIRYSLSFPVPDKTALTFMLGLSGACLAYAKALQKTEGIRFWHHSESDSFVATLGDEVPSDPACQELSFEEYAAIFGGQQPRED